MPRPAVFALLLLAACALPSEGGSDAGSPDAGAATGLPTTCVDACRAFTLSATFGGKTRAFERAQFGLTSPAKSKSGAWELYVEAHAGGDPACPSESSPTPDQTLVLSGVRVPTDAAAQTQADGVTAAFFDFTGQLTSEPLVKATAVRVTPRAVQTCLDASTCPAGADSRIAAFDLDATFPGGEIHGAAFALHCDAYDEE